MGISPTTRNVSDVYRDITRQFGDEFGVQVTELDILRWINAGCYDIVSKNNVLKKVIKTDANEDQGEYDLPADNFRIEWVSFGDIPIEQKSYAEIRERTYDTSSNSPQPLFWYQWADKVIFFPKFDATTLQGITIYYSAAPSKVTENDQLLPIPDRFYNRLIEYVLQQAHELDEDWQAAATKGAQFETGLLALSQLEENPVTGHYPTITVLDEDM